MTSPEEFMRAIGNTDMNKVANPKEEAAKRNKDILYAMTVLTQNRYMLNEWETDFYSGLFTRIKHRRPITEVQFEKLIQLSNKYEGID